ncbi:MAG: Ubiquinone biosynthesis O-methyltransferase [Holosporales bacterium]
MSKKKAPSKEDLENIQTIDAENVSTIDSNEVKTFNTYEGNWWDEKGPLKPLHELNPLRLSFIFDQLTRFNKVEQDGLRPYQNLNVLDVGCGAGLICEPFSRNGATVTGIDASETALTQARLHALEQNLEIVYEQTSIEKKAEQSEKFDVVLALEVLEHVENVPLFLKSCIDVLKDDGVLFISTINRTALSYLKAIVAAEYILRWVPKGTHQWHKFLKPSEIAETLQKGSFYFTNIKGIEFNPLKREWNLSSSLDTNYIACAVKRTHI